MPTPRENETQKEFISRCVRMLIEEEGRKKEQALAICYSLWRDRNEPTPPRPRRKASA